MNAAVIVAGGTGERLGRQGGKQTAVAAGMPVVSHTLAAFEACPDVDQIVLVAHPERVEEYRQTAVDPLDLRKLAAVVPGGASRQMSVAAGLAAVSHDATVIIVHDGARPLVSPALISRAITALLSAPETTGVVVGHPAYDTLKSVDGAGVVLGTVDRAGIWVAQTPQVFRAVALRDAYALAARDGWIGTDDASLVEHAGGTVRMLNGPRDNIKVTVAEDLTAVDLLLRARVEGERRG